MRKLVYYVATSLDGFVARNDDGIEDFSFEGEHVRDLLAEFPETIPTHLRAHVEVGDQNRRFDTVLMGRKTYEVGLAMGVASPYQHLRQYVFSRSLTQQPAEDMTVVATQAVDTVRELKAETGLDIWLCGGPVLASALIDEIDEVIVKVNPFLMGDGKSLFASEFAKRDLRLVSRRHYTSGFSLMHFALEPLVSS